MEFMTPKERIEVSLRKGTPDRVPFMDQAGQVAGNYMGVNFDEVRFGSIYTATCKIEFAKMSGTDIVSCPLMDPNLAFFGDLPGYMDGISLPDNNYSMLKRAYFETAEDIDTKELYDPTDPKQSQSMRKNFLDRLEVLAKMAKDVSVFGEAGWGPFTLAGQLRGTEVMLMDLMTEPELVRKVLNKAAEFNVKFSKVQLELEGLDGIRIDDPSSSSTLISRETYEEFGQKEVKMVADVCRYAKKLTMLHVCGDTVPMLEAIPPTRVDCFHIDSAVDLITAKRLIGRKVCIAGNIPPITEVLQGTVDSVSKVSKKAIQDGGEDGGFILAPGCETPISAPFSNIRAMYDAAQKYGNYY